MSKYKEILRYLKTTDFSERRIARELSVGRDTVATVRKRSAELNLLWEKVKNKDESEIRELLYPRTPAESIMTPPDYDVLIKELDRPGVTRKLLWEEYYADVHASVKCFRE